MTSKYSIDMWERCENWTKSEEGLLFWRWLELQADNLHDTASRDIGENPIKDMVNSQRSLASEKQIRYILQFKERIADFIKSKKKCKEMLTDLNDF